MKLFLATAYDFFPAPIVDLIMSLSKIVQHWFWLKWVIAVVLVIILVSYIKKKKTKREKGE